MPKSDIRRLNASRPQGIGGISITDNGREGPGASRSLRASLFELEILAFSKKVHMYGHLVGTCPGISLWRDIPPFKVLLQVRLIPTHEDGGSNGWGRLSCLTNGDRRGPCLRNHLDSMGRRINLSGTYIKS